ncbi:hypothetical protein AB3N62_16900 [Leptospira sp. WS4.C2]
MKLIYFFLLILSLSLVNCKDKISTKPESSAEIQQKLRQSKEVLTKRKSENHHIFGYKTKEEAIISFMNELVGARLEIINFKSILNDKEKDLIFFPNIYGENTALDVTPLEDYKFTFNRLEELGIKRLREHRLQLSDLKSMKIIWKSSRPYGNLTIYKVGRIEIIKKGSPIEITQIKSVIEQNGKFKVAVVAP